MRGAGWLGGQILAKRVAANYHWDLALRRWPDAPKLGGASGTHSRSTSPRSSG
jgi:hypothetical protein